MARVKALRDVAPEKAFGCKNIMHWCRADGLNQSRLREIV